MNDLRNKVALITGASSGIGEATARALSDAGMKLVVTARRADRLERLVGELDDAHAFAGDVADPQFADRLVKAAVERFGSVDFCFANAGIMNIGSIDDADVDALCHMVRVNIDGVIRIGYAALRQMKKQGSGDLVVTSSILGMKVRPTVGAYAGTKYWVEAWVESLRMEVAGSGVRVMTIEPGFTSTNLQSHWSDEQKQPLKAIERPLAPDDIARAVKFMIEQPAHVTIPRMLVMPASHAL